MEPKQKAEDAPKAQYDNLKAQCTYLLATLVNRHCMAVSLDSVELLSDMTVSEC